MGSETTLKLPVIDFNSVDLECKNPKWEEVKSQVIKALNEYGCFEASFDDKVPLELRKSLFLVLKELFDLPHETKLRNVYEIPYYGYLGKGPRSPLYESIGIDEPTVLENVESMEKTLWPEGHPSFSKVVQAFAEKVSELEKIFKKMVLESLGVEKYLEEYMSSSSYLMRVNQYMAPQTEDEKMGVSPHTDGGIVTILYQNEVQGLEVETKDGKWIKPSPHSFVVMLGDCFYAWTNGRVEAAFHRVMMRGKEKRYSAGLFSKPKRGHLVKAPEELVDEEHPLLFKPFEFIEFLDYYHTDDARNYRIPLKAYCGV